VHVLDDHHRRPLRQLLVHGAEDLVALGHGRRGPSQGTVAAAGHVPEGAQGARRHQVVAGAGQHPGVRPRLVGERADQGGLADPGLAGHQHHRAVTPAGAAQGLPQPAELRVALEQGRRHATIEASQEVSRLVEY
jgi:hypothetical protein